MKTKGGVGVEVSLLLKQVYWQTRGECLRADISEDEMVGVHLSAGLLRDIARICAPLPFLLDVVAELE